MISLLYCAFICYLKNNLLNKCLVKSFHFVANVVQLLLHIIHFSSSCSTPLQRASLGLPSDLAWVWSREVDGRWVIREREKREVGGFIPCFPLSVMVWQWLFVYPHLNRSLTSPDRTLTRFSPQPRHLSPQG